MPIDRHHRQQLLPGWGVAGQARVRNARVVVVGVGALGCVSSELLCRAGVGHLTVVDRDVVEATNLQRQVLYAEADLGRPKAEAAAGRLRAIDSAVTVEPVIAHADAERIEDLVRGADVLIDGTDNFETRYLLNDAAIAFGIPMVYGGAVATRGTVLPVLPGVGPCLRCLHADTPAALETCDTAGVLASAVAWVGARQAALACRILIDGPSSVPPRLEASDAWTGAHHGIDIADAADPDCPCCVRRNFEHLDGLHGAETKTLCGRNSVQIITTHSECRSLDSLAERLRHHGRFRVAESLLSGTLDRENGLALTVFPDGRAIVHGTDDQDRARAVYDRYIGS
ncbi:MAG: ThiF family adenylyltransferase [Planctomycetota bacterium]